MAIYHLTLKSGSRHKGASAVRKSDYITRTNQYETQQDKCLHQESGNMPTWAKDNARDYWQATDKFERANARLYAEIEFALPRELDSKQRLELAKDFAQTITKDNQLPYTLALHEGKGDHTKKMDQTEVNQVEVSEGKGKSLAHNPHAHLMISERSNDGLDRSKANWFKRANTLEPEQGGALKSRQFHGRQKIADMREQFAELTNHHLEKAQCLERVSHLSLDAQGIDRDPGLHHGPVYHAMKEKGLTSQRELRLNQEHQLYLQERRQQILAQQTQQEREAKEALERRMLERQVERQAQQALEHKLGSQEVGDGHTGREREAKHGLAGRNLGRGAAGPYQRDDLERETRLERDQTAGRGLESDDGPKVERQLDNSRGLDLG